MISKQTVEFIAKAISDNFRFMERSDESRLIVRVRPEHLGDLRLELSRQDGIVKAIINVETEKIKALLDPTLASLKLTMESSDNPIAQIEVQVNHERNNRFNRRNNTNQKHSDDKTTISDLNPTNSVNTIHHRQRMRHVGYNTMEMTV